MPRSHTSERPALQPPLSLKVSTSQLFCRYSLDHSVDGLDRPLTDDEGQEIEARNSLHQRRATTAWAGSGRTAPQPQPGAPAPPAPPVIEAQHARGAGVLRRLSLGGGLNSVRSFDTVVNYGLLTNISLRRPFIRVPPTRLLHLRGQLLPPLLP
jgi:hypothetical protein